MNSKELLEIEKAKISTECYEHSVYEVTKVLNNKLATLNNNIELYTQKNKDIMCNDYNTVLDMVELENLRKEDLSLDVYDYEYEIGNNELKKEKINILKNRLSIETDLKTGQAYSQNYMLKYAETKDSKLLITAVYNGKLFSCIFDGENYEGNMEDVKVIQGLRYNVIVKIYMDEKKNIMSQMNNLEIENTDLVMKVSNSDYKMTMNENEITGLSKNDLKNIKLTNDQIPEWMNPELQKKEQNLFRKILKRR